MAEQNKSLTKPLMYDVHQRRVHPIGSSVRWRIGYTTDRPVIIDYSGLVGLGLQFGLEQIEILELILGETFPASLHPPEKPMGWTGAEQWPYQEAVAALIAAGERKRVG
ncbi:hypothetical protein DA075_33280 [Methylobacterium currus]|uniref:Uncharacterized protein n=1 Tax=Methylobacterium currus TaxID=2051553 RepID=A0A2R4WW14_9HYPH|nr:hypothetical protein [Methylobacterium currus]AWB25716.1 hypothetical protein DA075_33280 [Methylobacterium currus]